MTGGGLRVGQTSGQAIVSGIELRDLAHGGQTGSSIAAECSGFKIEPCQVDRGNFVGARPRNNIGGMCTVALGRKYPCQRDPCAAEIRIERQRLLKRRRSIGRCSPECRAIKAEGLGVAGRGRAGLRGELMRQLVESRERGWRRGRQGAVGLASDRVFFRRGDPHACGCALHIAGDDFSSRRRSSLRNERPMRRGHWRGARRESGWHGRRRPDSRCRWRCPAQSLSQDWPSHPAVIAREIHWRHDSPSRARNRRRGFQKQ